MARELITFTYCDIHLTEKDEKVRGETYKSVTGQSVDLCDDCAGPLATAQGLFDQYGVTGKRTSTPRKTTAKGPRPTQVPEHLTCPDCGKSAKNRDSLASHARHRHGKGLAQLLGEPVPFACPDCTRAFATAAGLGRHRKQSHPDAESGAA